MIATIDQAKLPASTLTKNQTKTYGPRYFSERGNRYRITATVRHDDRCGNGNNTFSITAEIDEKSEFGKWREYSGGCCHDEVTKHFPELAPLIRWHLTSTDGPMHYLMNAKYWAGHCGWRDGKPNDPPNLAHLKSTIVFGAVPLDDQFNLADCLYSDARNFTWNEANANKLQDWLMARWPVLMEQFKASVKSLGFTY